MPAWGSGLASAGLQGCGGDLGSEPEVSTYGCAKYCKGQWMWVWLQPSGRFFCDSSVPKPCKSEVVLGEGFPVGGFLDMPLDSRNNALHDSAGCHLPATSETQAVVSYPSWAHLPAGTSGPGPAAAFPAPSHRDWLGVALGYHRSRSMPGSFLRFLEKNSFLQSWGNLTWMFWEELGERGAESWCARVLSLKSLLLHSLISGSSPVQVGPN